jgi:LAGLIDADG endonuclease
MTTILESQWIVGFVDGEGCFNLDVHIKEDMKWGIQMQPEFTVVQIEHDVQILHALKNHFGCGSVSVNRKDATSTRMHFRCKSVKDLKEKILPFFEKHKLKTKKSVEFLKFRDIVNLMYDDYHNKSLANFLEIVDKGVALRVRVSTQNTTKPSKRTKVDLQLQTLRDKLAADPNL